MKIVIFSLVLTTLVISSCEREKKENATTPLSPTPKATQIEESAKENNKVVARVNGRPIYEDDLKRKKLDSVIIYEILYERGLKKGLDKKFQKQIEDFKKSIIVDAMRKELSRKIPKEIASTEEIKNYYNKNESKYTYLRVEEITIDNKKVAEEIRKRALEDEDFEKIKSDYSNSSAKISVKDSRFSRRYNKHFENYELGSVSEIIPEANRFKIWRIIEFKKRPISNQKLAASIKNIIISQKEAEAFRELAEKIKEEDNIKVEILIKENDKEY